jgi:hypothetical protein
MQRDNDLARDPAQVMLVDDQQPVEELAAQGAGHPLAGGVRSGRLRRAEENPDADCLHRPPAVGVRGDAGQVSAAGAVLNDDQGVDAPQQHGVHMHEAGCEERSRVTIIVFARCLLVCPGGTERHSLTSAGTETGVVAHNSALTRYGER